MLFRHKITLYRFNQGAHTIAGGSNGSRGLSPPSPLTLTSAYTALYPPGEFRPSGSIHTPTQTPETLPSHPGQVMHALGQQLRLSLSVVVPSKLLVGRHLGNQPAANRSHKPGSRLPLLSARPAIASLAA